MTNQHLESYRHQTQSKRVYSRCQKHLNMRYCALRARAFALFSLQNHKCVAQRWQDWQFILGKKKKKKKRQLNRMWHNLMCWKHFKDAFHWKRFCWQAQFACKINDGEWSLATKYDQLTVNMHIQKARFDSKSLFMGENAHIFLPFINSKSCLWWKNGGEHNLVFCQMWSR